MLPATFIDHISDMFPSDNVVRHKIRPMPYRFTDEDPKTTDFSSILPFDVPISF